MNNSHNIPAALQSFQYSIESSLIPCATITQTSDEPTIFDSKFGGHAYMPQSAHYPNDEDGQPMLLLAQINFDQAKLPPLFPQAGMLQFFISPTLYEQLQQNPQAAEEKSLFYIRYYPYLLSEQQLVQQTTPLTFPPSFPLKQERAITFTPQLEPVSATDYRLHMLLDEKQLQQLTDDGRTYEDVYLEHYLGATHKIGGYPYFLEHDIRTEQTDRSYYDTLLLQIISDDEDDIMWGNSGVLKFFINAQSLQQLDFSNVLLHAEDY